ncbi:MAG: hypothetical protein U0263_05995 [Polyangiaceae bacterium]
MSEPGERRAESRAEPLPPRPRSLLAGGLMALVFVALVAQKLSRPRPVNVPNGLGGARLGASREQTLRALPGLREAPVAAAASPGIARYQGRTLLFDEPATCTLELAVNDALSRIECVFDRAPAPAQLEEKVLRLLGELYGKENGSGEGHRWQNERTRLYLGTKADERSSVTAPEGALRIASWTREHEARPH